MRDGLDRGRLADGGAAAAARRLGAVPAVPAVAAVLAGAGDRRARQPAGRVALNYTVDITVQNLGIALCVDRFVRVTAGPIHRFLNLRWLAYVGTLSYSIYLWQEPFLNHRAHTSFTAWPINLTLALVCAVTSYYLVERPFFALRDAWAARRRARRAAAVAAPTPP